MIACGLCGAENADQEVFCANCRDNLEWHGRRTRVAGSDGQVEDADAWYDAEASVRLARAAWDELPLEQDWALDDAGVGQEDWVPGFARALADSSRIGRLPRSEHEANRLARIYTDWRVRDPKCDPTFALQVARSGPYEARPPTQGPTPPSLQPVGVSSKPARRIDETPFDGVVRRLSDVPDLRIGWLRIRGAQIELLWLNLIVVVVWVPATMANTYRILVLRTLRPGTVVKAVIGWLGVVAVIALVFG